jgi:lipoate---protein ligase
VVESVAWILEKLCAALGVEGLAFAGTSDLALAGRKVSGNAQRRTREAVLHHGTLLYAFDARRSERLLRRPLREPAYRAGRGDAEFLGNLPLTGAEIARRLRAGW